MTKAYVLMTAMPPTIGHLHLIEFAYTYAQEVEVIICTQPGEPYVQERFGALVTALNGMGGIHINRIHKTLPQEPETGGFWDMWVGFLQMFGFVAGDYIVTSEDYGQKLAEVSGGKFVPYDFNRSISKVKATFVRKDPLNFFDQIIPEFQKHIRQTVTIFGAESTGKTTLAESLAVNMSGHFIFEWARPYLEHTKAEITPDTMHDIWFGQLALQQSAKYLKDRPFIVQDTDLFSTLGFWKAHEDTLGKTPPLLASMAKNTASGLYIITRSNIPFEEDPLRYGGDVRETEDQFWIDLCDEYQLNYMVLGASEHRQRVYDASARMTRLWRENVDLAYDRKGQ